MEASGAIGKVFPVSPQPAKDLKPFSTAAQTGGFQAVCAILPLPPGHLLLNLHSMDDEVVLPSTEAYPNGGSRH